MFFDWDNTKSRQNQQSRGFGFDLAVLIFEGLTIEAPDDRQDYGERRVRAIGEAQGLVLHIVYTDRGETRRIISARQANRKERAKWQTEK